MINIHPAVVHIPIGILSLYTVLEVMHFKKIIQQNFWRPLKAVLAISGTLGIFAALQSGELIEHAFNNNPAVLEMHQTFATASAVVYGVLAASYIVIWIPTIPYMQKYWNIVRSLAVYIQKPLISTALALLGFVCLTITGALGGAMVHGADVDPFVSFIYTLLIR